MRTGRSLGIKVLSRQCSWLDPVTCLSIVPVTDNYIDVTQGVSWYNTWD